MRCIPTYSLQAQTGILLCFGFLPSPRYFTKAQLERTASRFDGFTAEEEASLRREGAMFIDDVGKQIRVYVRVQCVAFPSSMLLRRVRGRRSVPSCPV